LATDVTKTSINKCGCCGSPFSCGLSRTSHFMLYPLHEHTAPQPSTKEDAVLCENLKGKTRRRRKEVEE
jgi:hypothetical protein